MSQNDGRIDVQIGGKTDEIDRASQRAISDIEHMSAAMTQAAQALTDQWAKVGALMQGTAERAAQAHKQAGDAAKQQAETSNNAFKAISDAANRMSAGVGDAFSGLSKPFAAFQANLGAIAVAIAGGAGFKKSMDAVRDQTAEAKKLSIALGITAEQANALAAALAGVFLDSDSYINGVRSVTRALSANGDAFKEMGIKTHDAQGKLLPMQEIIRNTVQKLDEYKAGVDRNVMANQLLGRNYEEVLKMSRLNDQAMKDAAQEVQDYHKQLDPAAVEAYKNATLNVNIAVEGVSLAIGRSAMPVFTELANWFASTGPTATEVTIEVMGALVDVWDVLKSAAVNTWEILKQTVSQIGTFCSRVFGTDVPNSTTFIVNAFKVVHIAVTALATTFQIAFEAIRLAVEVTAAQIDRLSLMFDSALKFDWSGVTAAWEAGAAKLETIVEASANRIRAIRDKGLQSMQNTALGEPETPKPEEKKKPDGNRNATQLGQNKDKKDSADKTKMPEYEARLSQEKLFYEQQNDLRQMSKTEELAYWRDILASESVTAKDRVTIGKKTAELELQVLRDKAKQARELKKVEVDEIERAALDGVQMEENAAQNQVATFGMTQERLLEMQRQFEDRRYQIQAAAQAERVALMQNDPNADPVALQAQQDKLLDLTRQYQIRKQQFEFQSAQQGMQVWRDLSSSVSSLWDKGVQAMMNGTLRWRNAIRAIGTELTGWFASSVIKPMVAQWLLGENMKTVATEAGEAIRKALGFTGSTTAIVEKKAEAGAVIPAEAAVAAGGAAAAVAGIPIMGPELAAAAYADTMAMVLGGLSVASAAGGYDIPAGLNPVTQLHEEEMVLPRGIANPLRKLLAGGQNGGEQSAAAQSSNMTVNYHDNSGRLSRSQIRENARTIAEELNRVHRDGWRPA
ncbi:MAG: hypothetical protein FWD62_15485 [Betaproteobacteria bacterium]|nr:hypothetical protein [Betaproteobacteria bacterium]